MQPVPPCSAPACWWRKRASGILLHWKLYLGAWSVGFIYLFFSPGYVALWDSKTPHRSASERVSWCLETYPLLRLPTGTGPSLTLLSLFLSFVFVLPPFEDNGLPFWVPGVLCQHSEVILWKLLSIQMIFWWICWGESGLSILFLPHLLNYLLYPFRAAGFVNRC